MIQGVMQEMGTVRLAISWQGAAGQGRVPPRTGARPGYRGALQESGASAATQGTPQLAGGESGGR